MRRALVAGVAWVLSGCGAEPACGANAKHATTCVECGPAGGCKRQQSACTPTCGPSTPCVQGVCNSAGVCELAAFCI